VIFAWRRQPFEAIRYAGLLFFYPLMYYFVHPEAYRMRPLDPFLVVLGFNAIHALCAKEAPIAERQSDLALVEMAL
jgi:hypothetical protein